MSRLTSSPLKVTKQSAGSGGAGTSTLINRIAILEGQTYTYTRMFSLDTYLAKNTRLFEEQLHGGISKIADGVALDSGTPINATNGITRLIVTPRIGSDLVGSFTITGDTVDRDTGAVTVADTEVFTMSGLSTVTITSDANGAEKHVLSDGYITSKWFSGAITVTTSDLTLTAVDVWQCAYEQFNDAPTTTIDAIDVSARPNNTSAWVSFYAYKVAVTADRVDITTFVEVIIQTAAITADVYYRIRRGDLAEIITTSTDGIFLNVFLGPLAQIYWENINIKIWAEQDATVVVT